MFNSHLNISLNLVYILKCEDECFYVGITSNLNLRLAQHFSGNGSQWTKRHKPIEIIKVVVGNLETENQIALEYINQYGYDRVRGGKYLKDKSTKICYWLKQITI